MSKMAETGGAGGTKVRVKDAYKDDAGRGITRMDSEIVNQLNLKTGDIIQIIHLTKNIHKAQLRCDMQYLYLICKKICPFF